MNNDNVTKLALQVQPAIKNRMIPRKKTSTELLNEATLRMMNLAQVMV